MSFVESLLVRAAQTPRRILFPDALDIRTLEAVTRLANRKLLEPILVGDAIAIGSLASAHNIDISSVTIIDNITYHEYDEFVKLFARMREHKGMTLQRAQELLRQPLYIAGMMLATSGADAVVAGSISTTSDVLRAALQTVGLQENIATVSSYFLMVLSGADSQPDAASIQNERVLCFADCGVVPLPTSEQLADIAYCTAVNYQAVVTPYSFDEPRVAFLSFSTSGSAESPDVLRVQQAVTLFHERSTGIIADGEMQADAALVASVAQRKTPHSVIQGNANVLVFPSLDAGNISYKLVERLAHAQAIGPIIQGLNKPFCDLSRGCSIDDIIAVAGIAALMV